MDENQTIPCVYADDVDGTREELGEDGLWVQPAYVRYPPGHWSEDEPPDLVAPRGLLFEQELLFLKDSEWKDTGNPVAAVESIILRHRAGIFPSVAVMEWLAKGFEDWHRNQGKKSLEACLGLKGPSGQAANKMKEAARRQMVERLLNQIMSLHCAFGIQIKDAAAMVAAMMDEPDWHYGPHKFKPLSEDTLMAYWKDFSLGKDEQIKAGRQQYFHDEGRKRELVSQYPRHAWQHMPELKAYL